jgi:hypothetical protein
MRWFEAAARIDVGAISLVAENRNDRVTSGILGPRGAVLAGQGSELDRYRALLRDADDEPKRLALIRLLIDEGAQDKFAAKQLTDQPEQQISACPDVSFREAALLEGGESTAPDPSASDEDVASLITDLLRDKPAPPVPAPVRVIHATLEIQVASDKSRRR